MYAFECVKISADMWLKVCVCVCVSVCMCWCVRASVCAYMVCVLVFLLPCVMRVCVIVNEYLRM
jgi:hypothetical protein